MISLFCSSRGRRRREPVEGVVFTTGGNGGASVEDEEDAEELLDEDNDDDEDTELSSSSFSGWCKGTVFAVALICMRGGVTSSGVSLFDLNHQTNRTFHETKTPQMHSTEKLCCFRPAFQRVGSFLRFQA